MKAKVVLAALALMLGSSAMAQQRIDKIVEELEQKGVDVNKVVKRDPKTKQIVSTVKSLAFYSKDSKYANRLREAFKKDAENAATETVSNHGNNYTLIFRDGKKRATYTLSISEGVKSKTQNLPLEIDHGARAIPVNGSNSKNGNPNPLVRLSIVIKDGDSPDFDWGTLNLDGIESLRDLSEYDWSKLGDAMEKWGEDFGKQMEKLGKDLKKRKGEKHVRERVRQKADSVVRQKRIEAEAIAKTKRS